MIDLLREADPDVIFTHSPSDYHPDHRYVSQLVFDSYFQKGLPHIPSQSRPACRFGQTQVYFMDTLAGIGFLPSEYVDITSVIETKRRMLRCHESQFRAVSDLASQDIQQVMEIQCAVPWAGRGLRVRRGVHSPRGLAARPDPPCPAQRWTGERDRLICNACARTPCPDNSLPF